MSLVEQLGELRKDLSVGKSLDRFADVRSEVLWAVRNTEDWDQLAEIFTMELMAIRFLSRGGRPPDRVRHGDKCWRPRREGDTHPRAGFSDWVKECLHAWWPVKVTSPLSWDLYDDLLDFEQGPDVARFEPDMVLSYAWSRWDDANQHMHEADYLRAFTMYMLGKAWIALMPRVDPRRVEWLAEIEIGLGMAWYCRDDFERSLAAYGRALALGNLDLEPLSRIHSNCGLTLQAAGRPQEAIESMQRAVELRQKARTADDWEFLANAETNLANVYNDLHDSHRAMARVRRASECMKESFALEPKPHRRFMLARALTNLARRTAAAGFIEQALTDCQAVVELVQDDQSLEGRDCLALCQGVQGGVLHRAERHEEARDTLQQALSLMQSLSEIDTVENWVERVSGLHVELASVWRALGDDGKASEHEESADKLAREE